MFAKFKLIIIVTLLISFLGVGTAFGESSPDQNLLYFKVQDQTGDQTGQIDIIEVTFQFSNLTGDYSMIWKATEEDPFIDSFRLNLNLFNADIGTTAQDPSWFNDGNQATTWFDLTEPTEIVVVEGNNPRLLTWEEGDRVALSGPIPLGVPDGIPAFGSGCVDLVYPYPRDSIGVGEFVILEVVSGTLDIDIDIKPGIEPNNLYCQWGELVRRGIFDVAILSTDSFDATSVDHTTVKFEGAREIHYDWRTGEARRHEKDVDRDGDLDLLFHFRLGDTDLECDSTEGTLIGETFDGLEIRGTDSVRMVNYNPPRPSPPPYYAAIPQAPNSTQAALTFGLLAFGCLFGAVMVIGVPSRFKNRK